MAHSSQISKTMLGKRRTSSTQIRNEIDGSCKPFCGRNETRVVVQKTNTRLPTPISRAFCTQPRTTGLHVIVSTPVKSSCYLTPTLGTNVTKERDNFGEFLYFPQSYVRRNTSRVALINLNSFEENNMQFHRNDGLTQEFYSRAGNQQPTQVLVKIKKGFHQASNDIPDEKTGLKISESKLRVGYSFFIPKSRCG